jgi:hypothetical protein
MKARLTDPAIGKLAPPPGKAELLVWDEGIAGLALRVGRARKAWTFIYRPRGAGRSANPQKVALGAWPAVDVKAARNAARIEAGRVARGENPALIAREAKRRELAKMSAVLDDYETSLRSRGYVSTSIAMGVLRRGLKPVAERDVATITRNEFVRLIEKLEREGKPGAAADLRKHARTLLEWTTNRGLTPFNALAGLRRDRATRAERLEQEEKGRALADVELAAIWRAADPEKTIGRYIRALILTGARRSEMARLHRSMILIDRIRLPATHTKQGRPHEIPITSELKAILDACPPVSSQLIFSSWKTGRVMSGWKTYLRDVRHASGVDFTLHDLRRTMRSGLSALGVDKDVAELAIGHQREELIRLYDKHEFWTLRVRAAAVWSEHVRKIAQEQNSF